MTYAEKLRPMILQHAPQMMNAALRLLPMLVKMGLTIYMSRYFDLADIGTYGLVIGTTSILAMIMGQDLIYVVSRDIVGADPATALHKMRDQAVLYGLNYLVLAVVFLVLIGTQALDVSPKMMLIAFCLTVLESFGTVTYFNLNSLNCQLRANALFFIRSGLWAIPVIVLCVIDPAERTADTVLEWWIIGTSTSLVATLWLWRGLPWKEVMLRPVNWAWIRQGIKTSSLVWIGMLGLNVGMFIDRFVVEHFLSREDVGVLTFYFSFTNALLTLTQSGVAAFTTPRLIENHRNKAYAEFQIEARNASRQIMVGAGVMALGLGVAVPLLGHLLGRSAFVTTTGVFLLMLFGTWIRASADMKYNILLARHQDRAIWLGNMLFLFLALGGNLLLVPFCGLIGIGYSAILSSALLLSWRWWHVRHYAYEKK